MRVTGEPQENPATCCHDARYKSGPSSENQHKKHGGAWVASCHLFCVALLWEVQEDMNGLRMQTALIDNFNKRAAGGQGARVPMTVS